MSDSDSSDDDFFSSIKKKPTTFHKRQTADTTFSPPSPHGRPRKKSRDTDDAMSRLERRIEHHKKKDHDVAIHLDEDSDVEEAPPENKENTTNAATASIELLSSDDEGVVDTRPITTKTPVSAIAQSGVARDACSKIQQARHAAFQLQQAQRYHAEDVYVPQPTPQAPVIDLDDTPAPAAAQAPTNANLGPSLCLKLRTTLVVNGKRSDTSATTESMSIRQNEPFQRLMERYQKHHSITPSESRVTFTFDGQRMDLTKTPAYFDMEDEDMIDVVVQTLALRTTTAAPAAAAPASNLGSSIRLKLRTSSASDSLSIRQHEPLQSIVDKYKRKKKVAANKRLRLEFDGAPLVLTKTPASYDMEDDDIIEVRGL